MFRKVLVYTYGDQSHDNTLKAAAALAERYGAQLTGLFVRPDVIGYSSVYGSYPLNLAQTFFDLQDDYCAKAKARFEAITAKHECRPQWHEVDQYERQHKPSFYADVIFVSQPDVTSHVIFNDTDFVDQIIMQTGLPIVVVPKNWQDNELGVRPVIGWKETSEAVGAVRHAMPLLRDAENTHVVGISAEKNSDEELIEGIEINEYLTEHGVSCEYFAHQVSNEDRNEWNSLLRHVNEHGRDLIVIGGYGHSRFREIVLGGMTRAMIQKSPVPVLLSH